MDASTLKVFQADGQYKDFLHFLFPTSRTDRTDRTAQADDNTPSTPSVEEAFLKYPKQICILLFNNYIEHASLQDSIFATIITSILENKTNPEDIFAKNYHCDDITCQCWNTNYLSSPCNRHFQNCYFYDIYVHDSNMFCSVSLYPSRYLSVFNLLENLKQEGLQPGRKLFLTGKVY